MKKLQIPEITEFGNWKRYIDRMRSDWIAKKTLKYQPKGKEVWGDI